MRALVFTALCLAACGGPRRDAALDHATIVLEHRAELIPDPRVLAVLALAYERAGRFDDAERVALRVRAEPLPDPLRARLATLDVRLAAHHRGEPPAADPQLRDDIVRTAADLERHDAELRAGTVREPTR